MASPSPTGVPSPKPPQRKTIGEMIQDLHKQIQAHGPGPHSPEQTKELDKLKILYSRCKSEQERLINEARKQQAQQAQVHSIASSHQPQITGPTQVTQVIAPVGQITQPRIAPAPSLAPRSIVSQSTPQSPVSQVGQPVRQVVHPTTAVAILPQRMVQTTAIGHAPVQTSIGQVPVNTMSIGQVAGQTAARAPTRQVTNIGQVPMQVTNIGPAQASGQMPVAQVHTVASIQQVATQQLQVQPGTVVTMQSQAVPTAPIKVSQSHSMMPQATMKAPASMHPQMVTVNNHNVATGPMATTARNITDRVTLPSPTQTIGSSNPSVTVHRTLIPNKVSNLVPTGSAAGAVATGTAGVANIASSGSVINKTLQAVAPSSRVTSYTPSQASRPDTASPQPQQVLTKRRIQELLREIDPREQMDEDVEDLLLQIADDFIESVVTASCQIAKHRKSNTLDVKDVQLHLERCWNMWIPGFGSDELRPYKKAMSTEAHKQRMALIRKTMKK